MYKDFAIISEGAKYYLCPTSFNRPTVAWYLNEPKKGEKQNARGDKNNDFYATRDIEIGEKLTIDYSTYSEPSGWKPESRSEPTLLASNEAL